jgi:hypothetical protein
MEGAGWAEMMNFPEEIKASDFFAIGFFEKTLS